jgi:AmiR/NasT family two-component response regulator
MEKIQVLIVEDELIIAEDMKEMLRELQYHVIGIASDFEEAGKILSSCVPDIALLDIHLQGNEDGITLALAIRERFDIPVVFISSYSDRKTVERAKQARPEGYIVKPFTKEDLFTSIEIAIFNHAKNRQIQPSVERSDETRAPGS